MNAEEMELDDLQVDENLALLVAELTDRLQKGQTVDLNQICSEHPLCRQHPALAAASAGLRQVHRSTQNFPTDQLWAEIDAKNERKLHPPLSFESCPVSVTQLTQASAVSFISSG